MTLTLNLPPESANRLHEEALRLGVTEEAAASALLDRLLAEMEAEDRQDVEDAKRILAEEDLSECYTLDDKREITKS
jgi:hypothetical protein